MILGLGSYHVVVLQTNIVNAIKAHYSGPQVETFVHVAGMGLR